MLGVELKGHDYKYEVAELLKLFTTQFRFIKDNEEYDKRIINSVNIDSNEVNSLTNYYEGENLVISKQESFDITKLNNEEVKKKTKTVIKRSMFKVLDKVFETYVPWGVLTGIRPVKIVHSLLDKGISESEIREILKNNYLIKDEKIDLALDIAKRYTYIK